MTMLHIIHYVVVSSHAVTEAAYIFNQACITAESPVNVYHILQHIPLLRESGRTPGIYYGTY